MRRYNPFMAFMFLFLSAYSPSVSHALSISVSSNGGPSQSIGTPDPANPNTIFIGGLYEDLGIEITQCPGCAGEPRVTFDPTAGGQITLTDADIRNTFPTDPALAHHLDINLANSFAVCVDTPCGIVPFFAFMNGAFNRSNDTIEVAVDVNEDLIGDRVLGPFTSSFGRWSFNDQTTEPKDIFQNVSLNIFISLDFPRFNDFTRLPGSIGGGAGSPPDDQAVVPGGQAEVPEPSTLFLLATGLAAIVGFARKRAIRH